MRCDALRWAVQRLPELPFNAYAWGNRRRLAAEDGGIPI